MCTKSDSLRRGKKRERSAPQNAKRTLTTPTQVCPRRARSRPTFVLRVEEGMRETKLTSRELETLTMNWQVGILYAFNFVLVLRWWKCKRRTRLRRPLTQSTGNCEAQVQELEPSTEVEGANSDRTPERTTSYTKGETCRSKL